MTPFRPVSDALPTLRVGIIPIDGMPGWLAVLREKQDVTMVGALALPSPHLLPALKVEQHRGLVDAAVDVDAAGVEAMDAKSSGYDVPQTSR